MKRTLLSLLTALFAVMSWAQGVPALEAIQADPKLAYGTDYPYLFKTTALTKAPRGFKPFYISHYARHGSRYYHNDHLYKALDTLLNRAHDNNQLTPEGEAFYRNFEAVKKELMTGVGELTQVGWDQHQAIARTMYNRFPGVFRKGGDVLAVSSLTGRCVISMSAFCQELEQCNPKIEIREQSSRFTLDGVVPGDRNNNPAYREWPAAVPRMDKGLFDSSDPTGEAIVARTFTSLDGISASVKDIAGRLVDMYTSLPSIGHEGMMGNLVTDEDVVKRWELENLDTYSWVFARRNRVIPILRDILDKAADVIEGRTDRLADLRFGHDSYIGPLTVLMGINGADADPVDPYEVKDHYQNWETCKASNIQLVFYRKGSGDVLVKCLLNGSEASLPVPTDCSPYYKWEDFRDFYSARCASLVPEK